MGKNTEELQATSSMTDPERGLEEGHKAGIRNRVDGLLALASYVMLWCRGSLGEISFRNASFPYRQVGEPGFK